jgi:bifunctional isochorismate lyase / aryl carrier protein
MAIPTIASYPMPGPADVPQSKVSWKPDARRSVLLIHDMQEYFLDFYNASDAPIPELIANIRRIREHCTVLGIPVVYTAQPAEQSAEHRGLLQDMWGDGLPSRPHRQPVVAELAPGPDDVVLTKWRYSAFQRSDLAARMTGWKRDQLIVCGIYAHIGCMMTACDAFMNDIQPFLVADALADFSAENHAMALTWVAQRCGVATSTADLLANLGDKPERAPNTLDEVRAEVASVLGVPVEEIGADDNLLYHGIDSIRIMSLVERWRWAGREITFVALAEKPTPADWWAMLSARAAVHA